MVVREIVRLYLVAHGLDGLTHELAECSCRLADLAPCGEPQAACEAARRMPCADAGCECCGDGHLVPAPQPDMMPELDWARACAAFMQHLGALARDGEKPAAAAAVKALDGLKKYVSRLKNERDHALEMDRITGRMLARQCDLAREAESAKAQAERERDGAREEAAMARLRMEAAERREAEAQARRAEIQPVYTASMVRSARQRDEAKGLLRKALLSADCTWEERREGHDWAEWCEMAREFLGVAAGHEEKP